MVWRVIPKTSASPPCFDYSGVEDPEKMKLEVGEFLNKILLDYDNVPNRLKCIFLSCIDLLSL